MQTSSPQLQRIFMEYSQIGIQFVMVQNILDYLTPRFV